MNAQRIRVLVVEDAHDASIVGRLSHFSIDLVAVRQLSEVVRAGLGGAPFDVVSIGCANTAEQAAASLDVLRQTIARSAVPEIGLSLMLAKSVDSAADWISLGADSVACCDLPPAMVALALFTAYNAGSVRISCAGRVRDLEMKLEETRLLNHAKSLIARQLSISEHEALQRLRKESRNQRRPMADLARIVIEANRIISGNGAAEALTPSRSGRSAGKIAAVEAADPAPDDEFAA
jgi:AmiR/NasT family two-component response regulator